MLRMVWVAGVVVIAAQLLGCGTYAQPLGSWRNGPARDRIIAFVDNVTDPTSPSFVPEAQRVAVFDNDGTLWSEQPAYFQLAFAVDRVKAMAPDHPEWQTTEPFRSVLSGDLHAIAAQGEKGILEIVMVTHAGMTTDEFAAVAREWITTSRHPTTGMKHTQMVYQPMLEVLKYLRSNGFKTYIVSGGGVEFLRVFAEETYGVPPEQVIGSSIKTRFVQTDNGPSIVRLPELNFLDDGPGKPVAINQVIGQRPIAAFGNSDGDLEMLLWTDAGEGDRLCAIVHHTDAEREWRYDRESHIGGLNKALDTAADRGWCVIDMQRDWARVFAKTPDR